MDEAEYRTRLRLPEEGGAAPEELVAPANKYLELRGKIAENMGFSDEAEICKAAHEAMRADQLNQDVAAPLRPAYLEKQAQNATRCAQRKLD